MGAKLRGLEDWDEALEDIAGRADDITPVADALHTEVLRQSRSANIPRKSGRLEDSIKNPRHPDHVFKAAPKRVTVSTKDPALVFNPQYSPSIDPGPLMDLIADYVVEDE